MKVCLGFDWQSNTTILGLQINEEGHLQILFAQVVCRHVDL